MRQSNCLIIKFGGASLATLDRVEKAAEITLGRQKYFSKIVVVASAMGQMTDQLLSMAYGICEKPDNREVDMLVSAGERISASLLSLALIKRGRAALSLTGSQTGIITTSEHCDARIIDVRPIRIPPLLEAGKIVVVAGFQGVSEQKEVTTLGRGGSDTTAVALGVALHAAKVEFYKDVSGIYSDDPKKDREAKLLSSISYGEAIELFAKTGNSILHPRSIELARLNNLPLHILSFEKENLEKNPKGSWIVENDLNAPKEALFEVYDRC